MSRTGRQRSVTDDTNPTLSPLPSAPIVRRDWPMALPILLILYIVCACIHASLVPIGQTGFQNAPDEAAHVNYVHSIATGRLPSINDSRTDPLGQSYEWHQPPLYYAVEALFFSGGVYMLRGVSILLGVLCILLIYRSAGLIFPENPSTAYVAAGAATLLPGHIAITSTVNNDVLTELFFSATLLMLALILRNGMTIWRAGWLGAALGCALLTKATALLLIPPVIIALILCVRIGTTDRYVWKGAGWAICVCICLCSWWYVRNAVLYHEWLPVKEFTEAFSGTAQARDVVSGKIPIRLPAEGWAGYWLLVSKMSFDSFWAVYGTLRLAQLGIPAYLPEPIYLLAALITLGGLIGLISAYRQRKRDFTETQRQVLLLNLVVIGLVALSFTGFLARYFQAQGRYMYPAMLPLCISFSLGWQALFPQRYRTIASILVLCLFGVMTIIFLSTVQAAQSAS